MAKISAKKSNLKTIANKIVVSPSTATVSDLKFKRKKDFSKKNSDLIIGLFRCTEIILGDH